MPNTGGQPNLFSFMHKKWFISYYLLGIYKLIKVEIIKTKNIILFIIKPYEFQL